MNMIEEQQKVLPVTILLTSYNRVELLKKTIQLINERTFYPYRIVVVDNNSSDGSKGVLKEMKVQGKIFDAVLLEENLGQCKSLNKGFEVIEDWENNKRRPSNDFIITTNEDIFPPMLGQDNCWLTQMIDILERNEPEYGSICMRIERTARNDIDETKEIIPCYKGHPSVFRLMRKSDIRLLGDRPFGRLLKWQSNVTGESYKNQIRKKFGFTTKIYASHAGFTINSGYDKDVDTFTVAENKVRISEEKPYPEIDQETNVPIKINHQCDAVEQQKRDTYDTQLTGNGTPKVTVLILTCHRLEGLKRVIESIKSKPQVVNYKILVMIDNDDTVAYDYCVENNIECLLTNVNNDFVKQANIGVYACSTPFFIVLGDDSEVITEKWIDNAYFDMVNFDFHKGLVAFNDGIQNGRLFTMGMSSKKFVEDIGGHLYYPGYKHFGGDREITRLAKEMGAFHYAEEIKVKHHHWQSDETVEKDATYTTSVQRFWQEDQRLKRERAKVDLLEVKNKYEY